MVPTEQAGRFRKEFLDMNQLLKIEHIVKYYGSRSSLTKAIDDGRSTENSAF